MKNETAILFQIDSPEFRLIYAMPTFVLDVQAPLMAIQVQAYIYGTT